MKYVLWLAMAVGVLVLENGCAERRFSARFGCELPPLTRGESIQLWCVENPDGTVGCGYLGLVGDRVCFEILETTSACAPWYVYARACDVETQIQIGPDAEVLVAPPASPGALEHDGAESIRQ